MLQVTCLKPKVSFMEGEQDHQLLLSSCTLRLRPLPCFSSHYYGSRESFTLKPTIQCHSKFLMRQLSFGLSRISCSNCAHEQCFFLSDINSEMVSVLLLMLAQLNRTGIRVHDKKNRRGTVPLSLTSSQLLWHKEGALTGWFLAQLSLQLPGCHS